MNYGQAIEAMRNGGAARRTSESYVHLAHRGTTLQYFEEVIPGVGRQPYEPSIDDQLATDWQVAQAPAKQVAA